MSPLEFAESFLEILTSHDDLQARRAANTFHLRQRFNADTTVKSICDMIESLTGLSQGPSTRERVQQFLDLHRDGGLGQEQFLGGARETAEPGDGLEYFELSQSAVAHSGGPIDI